jgi:hypothetical protein
MVAQDGVAVKDAIAPAKAGRAKARSLTATPSCAQGSGRREWDSLNASASIIFLHFLLPEPNALAVRAVRDRAFARPAFAGAQRP